MQFESRMGRRLAVNALASLALDAALIGIIVLYFVDKSERLESFFLLFLTMYGAALILLVKNTAWRWLAFTYGGRRFMANAIADFLRQNKFPMPERFETSAEGYLARVIEDDELENHIRLKAAKELGVLKAQPGITPAVQLSMAFEDAMEQVRGD